jgi:ATP-dependent helicase/nuclease subunit A
VPRWLQLMANDQLRTWDVRRVESLRRQFTRELARRGVSAPNLPSAVALVTDALINALGDERGRWLLGPQNDARNEYKLRLKSGAYFKTYVVDRIFFENENAWIVDYKTSRHEGGDLNLFLMQERLRYQGQLQKYANAVECRGTVSCGLYFPLLKGWITWDAPN